MLHIIRILMIVLCASVFAEEEIRVQLTTENPLSPIYIGRLQTENTSLPALYVNELDTLLQYNFNSNGITSVVTRAEPKEELIRHKDSQVAFSPTRWKEHGIPYVIRATLLENTLVVSAFSVENGSLKHFNEISLSGDMTKDRRQIHKISDTVQKALFNVEGIASSRILYCVQTKNPKKPTETISEIWECDWDGANARQITHENNYLVTPVAIPSKNERFLYVSYKLGQTKIILASTRDGLGKKVIDLKGNQMLPAISPSHDKIAFISDAGGRTDLFIQAFHPGGKEIGKPVQVFSFPRSTQASPTFNHDGSKLAFVSDKDGHPRIYVIPANIKGKRPNPTLITKQNKESSCPAWSPDGKKLAYSAKSDGVRQIWIYDFETKTEKQLTVGPGNKENPNWAPDSLHIVFNSTGAQSSELFVVNLNEPNATKITKGPGKKHYPSWGMR